MENENFNKKILYVTVVVLVIIITLLLYYNKNSESTYSEKICPTCPPQEPCTCPPQKTCETCETCPPEKICPTCIKSMAAEGIKGFYITAYKPAFGPGQIPRLSAIPDATSIVSDINECASQCTSNSSCNMFNYTNTGECKMYKSGTYSYDMATNATDPETISMSKI